LTSSNAIEQVEGVILVTLLVGGVFFYLHRRFARTRPDFSVGRPLVVAFGLRLAAIVGISATGLSASLRGGDELTFMTLARDLAAQPLGHGDFPHGLYQLHTVIFAMELKLGFLTEGAMRIVQVGIALTGVLLMLVVVHDFAGRRAARLAGWLIAFEPASIFFNSALHKDPNMELAAGLVVFGGAWIWRRLDLRGLLICALGGLIAVETRSYAGWFLVAAVVLLLLHAALRNIDRPLRAMPVIYGVIVISFVTAPVLLQLSSSKSLKGLQGSQNANTQVTSTGQGGPNGNNLALEQVNFSSRGAIISNLPKRIRDLILEPYPWQLGDTSQRFGALGTLFAYAILILMVRYAWLNRGHVFGRAGPLLYPLFFLLVAYSLSVGNAGTGFRYRTHLVTLSIAIMVILREHARRRFELGPEDDPALERPDLQSRVAIPV
jgi:hypothetical protein